MARKLGRKVGQILAEREVAPAPEKVWDTDEPQPPQSGGNTRTFAAQAGACRMDTTVVC